MKRIATKILPFVLIGTVILLLLFFPKKENNTAEEKTIVEVWNIDTFEGGKGSRTAFLNKIARDLQGDGVYFYVLNYTVEGAREAFSRGKTPDMLSFGVGFGDCAESCLPLELSSLGGEIGGKCLAVPWCAGKYFRFSLSDNFDEEGKTAISVGGANLSAVAARLNDIEGEEVPSDSAYVGFLNGEYRYLLGTQRDENRFRARNLTVYSQELTEFNDIFQYISIFSKEKKDICLKFLDKLLSNETQERLSEIGMYPPSKVVAKRTVNVFTSDDALEKLRIAARDGDGNFLEKSLKSH